MVLLGTKKDVARIVDYQRFYKPKIKEFVKGFKYEYVQLSFKKLLVDLPDLDNKGKKPGCIYYESWCEAIWGTPFSIFRLSHIKQLMKKDRVRAKKKMSTKYLKDLLEKQALAFNYKGLHVVIFPKKVIQHNNTEILDQHNIYINGVKENLVRSKNESKLYKRWFNFKVDNIKMDWRYLLGLDWPEIPGTNVLYLYFEGIYTKSEDLFKNICDNFMTGGPENPPNVKKTGMSRGYYAAHKQALKETKYANVDSSMKAAKFKHKLENELSGHVLEERKLTAVKRIEQTVREEMLAAIKEQKRVECVLTDDRNRQKMEQQVIVCIQNTETKEVLRIAIYESVKYIKTDKWIYVEKYLWKTYMRLKREERKKESGKNRIKPSSTNRKMKRKILPRFKPGFKFIQHKKKAVEYETETHENKEYYTERTEPDMWPESEYEYIPVTYGKFHKKAGQPFMIFSYDEEGNKILKQAIRRQLKQVFDAAKNAYIGCKLVKVERWKRIVKESEKSLQNVKSKKQMETSKYTSTRIDKRSRQKDKSVEKVRGDDKRVKTPNIKH
jgi:hypothetical protein